MIDGAFALGPLVLPHALLLLFAAVVVSLQVGKRIGGKLGLDVEPSLWGALLAALVVARLAFVLQYHEAYLEAPLGIIDIRDGGWNALAGIVGGWLFILWRGRTRPAHQKPLRRAALAGTALWLAGTLALVMLPQAALRLPALDLSALDGSPVRLDSFRGQPTVVNLWATWCPPCVREMPMLQQAQQKNPAVHFVFLNQGESATQVEAWLAKQQLPLRNVLIDQQASAAAALGHKGYPTTLFFDADGQLVASRVGELSSATLLDNLKLLQR
ncbi:redoxin family protein [Piscinibacter sakaiensis]|uniref:redoxin family protein n=1 Tax=Piscinibacter sakaiensis TaxID=1547922 RepID=UPI003AACFDE8